MQYFKKINLLKSLPKTNRNIKKRKLLKNSKIIKEAQKFGKLYFDGPREYGYGGYYNDGRWKQVAKDIKKFYNLNSKSKVLDVGCAKGFLVEAFQEIKVDAYGIDISSYAIKKSNPNLKSKFLVANALSLPFSDDSFDLVLSINTIHNLKKIQCLAALKELIRVSKKHTFVQVDAYYNQKQKKLFQNWVLTAKYHDYPDEWRKLFKIANYKGHYFWTILK
ncbi:class I SAM-dependent methyltransferase [Pelagibacteraceae bacterium]|nr:class I SAM-dependent methyltransferase [Pelagibacteraceae bacterium]